MSNLLFTLPPLDIVDLPADAAHAGGVARRGYRFVFLHSTGGVDSRKWLSTTSNPPVSCNRLITKEGIIYKIVPDDVVAYTQGPSRIGPLPRSVDGKVVESANEWALSIELENKNDGVDPYPRVQVLKCAWQVAEWHGAHGELAIVAHTWMQANKTDPMGFPWILFYQELDRRKRQGVRTY